MAMRMDVGLVQSLQLRQTLSPQMYLSMEILLLPSLDLQERIEAELQENPVLEVLDEADGSPPPEEEAVSAPAEPPKEKAEETFERLADYEPDGDYHAGRPWSYDGEKDERLDALRNTEGHPMTLQEYLENQVRFLSLSPRIAGLVGEITGNLDERGYLIYSLEEVGEGLDEPATAEELAEALGVVQSLDPPGVGGRDLKECLLLQLRPDPKEYPVETAIIENHLDDLAKNRLPKIARALGVTVEEVKSAAGIIAQLNPRPGSLFSPDHNLPIRPDVIVEYVDGRYEVRVESEYFPSLRIRSDYRELVRNRKGDPEARKYVRKKIEGAEWLMNAIRQRQATLYNIAVKIVEIQREFLDKGIKYLKPLKMQEVADQVGVHVSTISRAISGKYMQVPRGIYEMKSFFTGGATKDDGTVEARGSIIQRIRELIDAEDKKSPLSDLEIVRRLKDDGIKISRRTVTKYREQESIPSSRERRAY